MPSLGTVKPSKSARRVSSACLALPLLLSFLASAQAQESPNIDSVPDAAVSSREAERQPEQGGAESKGLFLGLFPRGARLAPIRWSGQLSDQWQRIYSPDSTAQNHYQTLRLAGTSYFLHPAIASLNGNLNLSAGKSTSGDQSSTRYSATSGGLGLSALTRTGIPLTVTYSVADSRTDSVIAISDFRTTSFGYQQSYRPFGEPYSANWNYSRSRTVGGERESRSDVYAFALSSGFGDGHSLNWSTSYNDSESTGQFASNSKVLTSYLAHGFSLEYYYRVNNTVRFQQEETGGIDLQGNLIPSFTARSAQLYNAVMWIPSDDYPLTLNSSISLNRADSREGRATVASGNLSGHYQFSDRLSATIAGSGSVLDAGSTQVRVGALAGTVTYRGDERELGDFTHRWDTSAGVGATRRTGGASQNAQLFLSQTLDRAFEMQAAETLSLSFGQALGLGLQRERQGSAVPDSSPTTTVSHSADLAYSRREGEQGFSANLRFQDSRNYADSGDSTVQILGATADGDLTLDRLSAINGSIGWVITRTVRETPFSGRVNDPVQQSGSGNIRFSRRQPFGWRAANYGAALRLNIRKQGDNAGGFAAFDESTFLYSYGAEHDLTASIGLLSTTLRNDFLWNEGGQLIWGVSVRVTRDF